MKRILTLILSLCLCCSLLAPCASAAVQNSSLDLIYSLSVDGNDTVSAEQGSIITVTFSILRGDGSNENYIVSALQNEIIYDQNFFEFVDGSIKVSRSGGCADFQTRVNGTHIIKASYLSAFGGTYQAEEVFCSFQLKVRASSGSGWISCDWTRAKAYDKENNAFGIKNSGTSVKVNVTTTVTGPCHSFTDVNVNDWFHSAVDYVEANGLMNGTGGGLFDPQGYMTRAMLVTTLYRLEGEPAVSGTIPYSDVQANEWYTNAVIWATENSIVNGYGNGLFGTTDNVTREQIATIMYRYSQFKGYDVTGANDLAAYTDAGSVSDWALASMRWANAVGLITGRTTTTLVPQGIATRAEVATILMRFCQNIAKR